MPVAYPQIQPFLDYLKFEKRYSQHTFISYQTDLVSFFEYLFLHYGETPVPQISHLFIRSWLAALKEGGATSKTINRKISTLRSFFKHSLKTGAVGQTPMAKIIAPKAEKRLPQFVAEKDMATLLHHVEFSDDWNGQTEKLLLQIFYNTGLRVSELINLKESGVDTGNNTLKVLGKGSKERIIPVSAALMSDITHYLDQKKTHEKGVAETVLVTSKGAPLAARSVYNMVKKNLSLVTTINKRSPHVLRHTFATHLLNGGATLNAVKELLGHSSLASTQVYTHNTIEKLKNAHQKAHPKG